MQSDSKASSLLNRRRFLLGSLGAAATATLLPAKASAKVTTLWEESAVVADTPFSSSPVRHRFDGNRVSFHSGEKYLSLYSQRTGETLRTVYWAEGEYLEDELKRINHMLRDFRTDDIHPIDTALLDTLHAIQSKMELSPKQEFHIISAYRSPRTNAMLRERGRGVAKNSYHMRGQAIDINLPNRDLNHIRKAALALKSGGVGYYPRSGFVHVDVGPVRTWG